MTKKIDNETLDIVEKKIISNLFNDNSCIDEVIIKLDPSDFSNRQMAAIYKTIIELHKEGRVADIQTVTDYFNSHKEFQFNNYDLVIEQTANIFSTSADVEDHIDMVKNASIKRQLNNFAEDIINSDADINNFDSMLSKLQAKIIEIASSKRSTKLMSIDKVAAEYIDETERLMHFKDTIMGTGSGFSEIDELTNGFIPGDITILAARPSVGKTALALKFLVNAAKEIVEHQAKDPSINEEVIFFSLEMSRTDLFNRIVAAEGKVDLSSKNRSRLDKVKLLTVQTVTEDIKKLPIKIYDGSDLTILDIQSMIKQESLQHKVKLVVIDYLGLLKGDNNFTNNRQGEIAYFSRTLKQIARSNNVPILVLAQLNRQLEQRKGKDNRPILADLRDSGAIEQDADVVAFLSRVNPNGDQSDDDEAKEASPENTDEIMIEFYIAKNRKGPTGSVKFWFIKRYIDFYVYNSLINNEKKNFN